jgi:hypothetical protein
LEGQHGEDLFARVGERLGELVLGHLLTVRSPIPTVLAAEAIVGLVNNAARTCSSR